MRTEITQYYNTKIKHKNIIFDHLTVNYDINAIFTFKWSSTIRTYYKMIIKYSTHKNIFRSWLNRKTGNKYSFFVRNENLFLSVVHESIHTTIKSIIVLIDDNFFCTWIWKQKRRITSIHFVISIKYKMLIQWLYDS